MIDALALIIRVLTDALPQYTVTVAPSPTDVLNKPIILVRVKDIEEVGDQGMRINAVEAKTIISGIAPTPDGREVAIKAAQDALQALHDFWDRGRTVEEGWISNLHVEMYPVLMPVQVTGLDLASQANAIVFIIARNH